MELRIEPTNELSLKLKGNRIGRLDALCLDVDSGGGLLGVPKVSLAVSVNQSAFENEQLCEKFVNKLSKFKFLQITLLKPRKDTTG